MIGSRRYLDGVTDFTYAKLADEFGRQMDLVAKTNPDNYHHVYEWRLTGLKRGRLWRSRVRGRGKDKVAAFEFKASRTPIPSPMERRHSRRNDPIKNVPMDVIRRLSNRKHFFYWKAPIMENGTTVTIRPKYASALFIPLGEGQEVQGFSRDRTRGYVFTKNAVQSNPGGGKTTGRFTAFWVSWWSGPAHQIFTQEVMPYLQSDAVKTDMKRVLARYAVPKTGARTGSMTNAQRAYEAGQQAARVFYSAKARSYTTRAKAWREANES
jgi:hypothetical protein